MPVPHSHAKLSQKLKILPNQVNLSKYAFRN